MKSCTLFLSCIAIVSLGLFTSCSEDDTAESNIEAFAGTYVGKYRALAFDTDDDTVVVTVDAANDRITITSAILGTSFDTEYDLASQRGIISNLTIDTLKFVQGAAVNYAYNTTVSSGHCEMRNNDTKLYIQLNECVVEDHTFGPPLEGITLTIPVVNTPNNMNPL